METSKTGYLTLGDVIKNALKNVNTSKIPYVTIKLPWAYWADDIIFV